MIAWTQVDSILLDMDGTLLDLHFDNHFWLEHVPRRYGEKHGMSPAAAKAELYPRFRAIEGTLNWYCVDHWTPRAGPGHCAVKAGGRTFDRGASARAGFSRGRARGR